MRAARVVAAGGRVDGAEEVSMRGSGGREDRTRHSAGSADGRYRGKPDSASTVCTMTVTANLATAGNHCSAATSNGAMEVWIRSSKSVPVRAAAVMGYGSAEMSTVARDGSAWSALGFPVLADIGQKGAGPRRPGRQGDKASHRRRPDRLNGPLPAETTCPLEGSVGRTFTPPAFVSTPPGSTVRITVHPRAG